jgi:tetratricopeptide (TPR) repeat protein
MRRLFVARGGLLFAALGLAVASVGAQAQGGRATPAADTLVQQVRTAIGHGAIADARRLVDAASGPAASRELAAALIEIFEGKDDAAKARLTPLASATPLGDASLELGLLEMRHGRRDDADRWLRPVSDALRALALQNVALTPDDYFKLARAAEGIHEFQLANDAYKRVATIARADIQTQWGDLFMRYHQPADAATSYGDALKADPSWVRAHLGLAQAYSADDPRGAQAELDAVRKLAPDHPDLWLAIAQQRIENDDIPGTVEALDRAARVRSGSIEESALRVAVAFEAKDAAALPSALARVTAIDPRSARGLRAAGQQAAHDYRFDEAAEYGRKAVALDPDDAVAHAELGLFLLRTGDENGGRAELERSWEVDPSGRSDRVTLNLFRMLDSLEKFEVVPDGDLIFKFPKADAAVLKVYALPLGELAYKTFSERYGFKPQGPILVEIFSVHDDFAVRTTGLMGITGALGACFGRVVTLDSPRARPPGEFSWQATEWHELAHVFTLQLSKYRVPRWLTEGISVFEEHRRQAAWGREMTLEFAAALGRGKTFGVKGLPEAFKNPENFSMAYFEASLVVEHLVDLNGDAGVRTLLKAYADGATDAEAFTKAFGKSLDDIEASYKAFIDKRYGALREAMKAPPSQVEAEDIEGLKTRATVAPGNFASQLSFGQALVRSGDLSAAKAPLERAAALAPEASGAGSPHALLADIAAKDGDEATARKELRALLTWDHANVTAARRLAALAGAAKATDDEDFALRLVADLDPFDATTHGLLGRRLMAKNDQAGALVEFQAALAMGPTNLAEAHADVAEALLKLGRRDEAKREALAALKEAPTFARAQDLLLAAMGKD